MENAPKYRYKNISDQTQAIINVGEVAAGAVIETEQEILNPNFELVVDSKTMLGVDPKTPMPKRK